jgi:hypothetical protein
MQTGQDRQRPKLKPTAAGYFVKNLKHALAPIV